MLYKVFLTLLFLSACTHTSRPETQLDKIVKRGVLKVGTTGDYAPFSEKHGKSFRGIDIDMAKDLAQSLGVRLVLVPTSWPQLTKDLKDQKFDIAMSGISKKLDRQKIGLFSKSYVRYGKMGIARCKEAYRYKSLKSIDRKGVRVMVNPGGTNQSFALKNIKKARIITYPNNSEIFEQIIKGNADIMMTDSIEVKYQSKKHKGVLCPTMKNPMTQSELAIFMVRDLILKEYIDTWLHLFEIQGRKKTLFDKYLL